MSEKQHNNRQSLDDLTQLSQMARKMMARLDELLDTQQNDTEHLGGRNSLVSALNTLTTLVLALEARERVLLEGGKTEAEKPLPVSEADIQLLEQFLAKQR